MRGTFGEQRCEDQFLALNNCLPREIITVLGIVFKLSENNG